MRLLAILLAVLMLVGCGSQRRTAAWHAECRLEGYEQGTQPFNDCVTVKREHWLNWAYAAQRRAVGNSMQAIGQQLMRQQPAPMPAPTVAPKTRFCYPGQGFTYCQ